MSLLLILLVAAQPVAVAADGLSGAAQADAALIPAETAPSDTAATVPATVESADAAPSITIPKLTPISIEVLQPLGSKLSKTGDMFPIQLAAPILVDGVEVVPAGTPGMGEVIHAKKGGGLGAAGELVLTARYLEFDGRRLPLRSMHLVDVGTTGESRVNTVNAIAVGSATTIPALSIIGFFIDGGQANVTQGALADAKTAQDFAVDAGLLQAATAPGPAAAVQDGEAGGTPATEPQLAADTNLSMGPITREGKE